MSKLYISILGTTAGVPTKTRAHSAVFVTYNDEEGQSILFDCGEGTQRQLLIAGLKMSKLDHIFITHLHGDHCLGLPGLVDTLGFERRKRVLNIYAPEIKKIKKNLFFRYSQNKYPIKFHNVQWKRKRESVLLETERFKIISAPAEHGIPAVSYAFLEKEKTVIDTEKIKLLGLPEKSEIYKTIKSAGKVTFNNKEILLTDISMSKEGKKFVYSGDTEICDTLMKLSKDADLLIQDCTYFETDRVEKEYKHASLYEIIEMVEKVNIKSVVLTHISRKYSDPQVLREKIPPGGKYILAEDFTELSI